MIYVIYCFAVAICLFSFIGGAFFEADEKSPTNRKITVTTLMISFILTFMVYLIGTMNPHCP